MKAKSRQVLRAIRVSSCVEEYLQQCRVKNPLVENASTSVPPTKQEVDFLMSYLGKQGLEPALAGSVGLLHHLGGASAKSFRPTFDLDVWVNRAPGSPPSGWRRDPESLGVVSWISPSGGIVDFMSPGHKFPGGEKLPHTVDIDRSFDYPVVGWKNLMLMKLNSVRDKDIADLMALVRKLGKVPSDSELGKLNPTQKDNLGLIRQWYGIAPSGGYGESLS